MTYREYASRFLFVPLWLPFPLLAVFIILLQFAEGTNGAVDSLISILGMIALSPFAFLHYFSHAMMALLLFRALQKIERNRNITALVILLPLLNISIATLIGTLCGFDFSFSALDGIALMAGYLYVALFFFIILANKAGKKLRDLTK